MRLSRYFLPVTKETPAEAAIASHQLMLRAGLVRQESSGIYSWLPYGQAVLANIAKIVREEQNRAGALEMLMPTIQSADLWRESGRYDDYGEEMLRITDRHKREMLYGPTNEEMITAIFRSACRSYKDLPKLLYHVQWKFRDEVRPRFGVMRGREFLMKDCYSFDLDEAGARASYNRMFLTYLNTFARMGLKAVPMRADTGPIGGDLSHEFIILAETGESQVFCHSDLVDMPPPGLDIDFDGDLQPLVDARTALYAATDEIFEKEGEEARFHAEVPEEKRASARGIEVGHIFYFGEKYSAPMNAVVTHPDGGERPVHMGSYGVGVSRLVGGVIEAHHDDRGIIWPEELAPFKVGIVNLRQGKAETDAACETAYAALMNAGRAPLYDDTHERPGAKLSIMELIGTPALLIIGPKGLEEGTVEVKERATGATRKMSLEDAIAVLADGRVSELAAQA